MPRGKSGKSMLGTNSATSIVSGVLQTLNANTKNQGNVKNVEDVQVIIGIFNVAVNTLAAAKKTLTN
jgi:hypothetical protein